MSKVRSGVGGGEVTPGDSEVMGEGGGEVTGTPPGDGGSEGGDGEVLRGGRGRQRGTPLTSGGGGCDDQVSVHDAAGRPGEVLRGRTGPYAYKSGRRRGPFVHTTAARRKSAQPTSEDM